MPLPYAAHVIFPIIVAAYVLWYVRILGNKRNVLWWLKMVVLAMAVGFVGLLVVQLPYHCYLDVGRAATVIMFASMLVPVKR